MGMNLRSAAGSRLACFPGVGREGTVENREKGFSLVELMVAMTVTLIITGAVFKLVTAGHSAFRREPAMAERQQNIRVALDIISQDLYRAGHGTPTFAQVFTDGLDGAGDGEGNVVMGSGGAATDVLEMFSAGECEPQPVCDVPGNGSVSMTLNLEIPSCAKLPGLVLVADETKWAMRWAHNPTTSNSCPSAPPGAKNGKVNFPHGRAPLVNPPGGFNGWIPDYMLPGEAIRYRINPGADGVPNLERSAFGGQEDLDGNSTWQIIAGGIEDLQVEYENGAGWQDEPGDITCTEPCGSTQTDYDKLIRRVRVRLSARVTESGRLAGETTAAAGPNAVRGQLVTEIAPRPATAALQVFGGEL
jgi:prepilin-type N-terminal cleavage/methylation domain-containing protein